MGMLLERHDHQVAAAPEDTSRLAEGPGGLGGVRQHVEEQDLIEAPVGRRDRVDVTPNEAHALGAGEPVTPRTDDPLAQIEAGDASRPRREERGDRTIARAGVEDVAEVHEAEQRTRGRLPRAAGRVVALHLTGDRVRPSRRPLRGHAPVLRSVSHRPRGRRRRRPARGASRACAPPPAWRRRSARRPWTRPDGGRGARPASRSRPRCVETRDWASSVIAVSSATVS